MEKVLAKMIMDKEGIKGGAEGFKKISQFIDKLIKEALGGSHKDKNVPYDDALKAATKIYTKK